MAEDFIFLLKLLRIGSIFNFQTDPHGNVKNACSIMFPYFPMKIACGTVGMGQKMETSPTNDQFAAVGPLASKS